MSMIQPFVQAEFNTWKGQVDTQEKVKAQVEKVNKRVSSGNYRYSYYDYAYESHYDRGYYVSHSDKGGDHTDFVQDRDWMGSPYWDGYSYHVDSGTPHSDSGGYGDHSDYGGYTYSYHVDGYQPHSDVGFDHNDFVPSTPRIFKLEDATIPRVRDTLTLGFYSYDKNKDGFGTQDTRSKVVYYDVKIRQVLAANGTSKVSAWRTLVNNQAVETYNLNTVDPLGTGNTDGKLTEGTYEIEVTARNAVQTVRGVTQTYESTKQVKQIKIQQNQDPLLSVSNHTSFLNFTFGNDHVRTTGNQLYTYQDYANQYNLNKLNGLLVNMVVTERDKDQYLKGTGWIETSAGVKVAGTEHNIVWENGATSIKTNGISDYTAQLLIPKDKLKLLTSGSGYKIVVQIRDYLDAACTQSAGATLTQKTVSATNLTQLAVGVDMVLPTIVFSTPSTAWLKDQVVNVKLNDDFIGVDKWRYRILTDGVETTSWSAYKTTTNEDVTFTATGQNVIEVEVIDKVGNTVSAKSGAFKTDKTAAIMTLTPNTENWVPDKVTITANATDPESGVKRLKAPDGTWRNGSTTTFDVTANGTYTFEVENNVGIVKSESITITNIDDIQPEIFELASLEITENSIEVEITGAEDKQSGLHDTPFRFSKDGGSTWTSWQVGSKYKFTGLSVNKSYNIKAQVRDKAANARDATAPLATLTKDIELKYMKTEGSNDVLLTVDLKGNPTDTPIMITRQNLITNEVVTIKNWNNSLSYRDRVPTFVVGYRYTAYAINRDQVIGNGASVVIKDIEKPEIDVKGFGSDKYVYDKDTQSLFLLGNSSGFIEVGVKTLATEKLIYSVSSGSGGAVKEGENYGRVGEFRHNFTVPVEKSSKEIYTIKPQAEYEDFNTGIKEVKDLIIPNNKITVYRVDSLADLFKFQVNPSGTDMDVSYHNRTTFKKPSDNEVLNNLTVRTLLNTLTVSSTGGSKQATKGTSITLPQGNLTVEKQVGGGTYKETFKQGSVLVSTNIGSFVTNLVDKWKLEVYVTTDKGRYTLPRDMANFRDAGYDLEVVLANGKTSAVGVTTAEQFADVKLTSTALNLETYEFTSSTVAMIGIKVTEVLPTYHVANLNLQSEAEGNMTLDAVGNANIKYDKTFIYNRMSNVKKPHNENIYDSSSGDWTGTLYYRTGTGGNKLVLTTNRNIKVINPTDLNIEQTKTLNNKGSILVKNQLYVGTNSGLKKIESNGDVIDTSITKTINALESDGFNVYIATMDGLSILDGDLKEIQFIDNSQIFGAGVPIQTLHISNGKIYVSDTLKGNKYKVIGK